MEENKELEQKKEHGFKSGVLTGVLGTVAVVLAAGAVLFAHGNLKVSETAGTSQTAQTVLDDGTLSKLDELMGQINLNYYEDVDASDLQEGLYSGLLEGLSDPYSAYYTEEEYKDLMEQTQGNFYGIGAGLSQDKESMQVTITKVYEDTPAEKAGLKAGDVIVKVDDIDATSMEVSDLVQHIRGEEGTTVHLEIYRPGESDDLEYDIERAKVNYETVTGQLLDGGIGYIYVSEFGEDTANQFEKTIADLESQGMKAMIVDLRNNGGGMITAVTQMLDDILPEAHEHLRGGLPADAAAREVVLLEEVGMVVEPPLGDGVAHEDHLGFHGQVPVHLGEGTQPGPVAVEHVRIVLPPRSAHRKEAERESRNQFFHFGRLI